MSPKKGILFGGPGQSDISPSTLTPPGPGIGPSDPLATGASALVPEGLGKYSQQESAQMHGHGTTLQRRSDQHQSELAQEQFYNIAPILVRIRFWGVTA